MTVEERKYAIAYADLLQMSHTLEHIYRVVFDYLPPEGKVASIHLDDALQKLKEIVDNKVAEMTDWEESKE